MPESNKENVPSNFDGMDEVMTTQDVALGLYTAIVANGVPTSRLGEAVHRSFQSAEVFLKFADKYARGEVVFEHNLTGPQPQKCCAPNLPVMHPINLIASSYTSTTGQRGGGNLNRVAKIYEKIKNIVRQPDDESRYEDTELGISWSRDELLTAQKLFPDYIAAPTN